MTDKPRFTFKLELNFSRLATHVDIENPTLIPDQVLDQAWCMVSDFVIDMLDNLGEEVTDERFREVFIEVCYRLVYREMTTLHLLPIHEQNFKERLGTRKIGPRVHKTSPYDDRQQ